MMEFQNQNPTKTEKEMYFKYGLYPVKISNMEINNKNILQITYACCYTEPEQRKEYPNSINIDEKNIDYNHSVFFDSFTEDIKIKGYADVNLLSLIIQRADELGYNYSLTH